QVITLTAVFDTCVYATDLDGDGDADFLSASNIDDKIAWYENLGGGSFGSQQVITLSADAAESVYATDLDGDGDADVLSASYYDDKIAWYENLGGGSFGSQQVITTAADYAASVYATDLDGDGAADVLSASQKDSKIAWYENQLLSPCPSGACLDLTGNAAIGNFATLWLQSPSPSALCYVLADAALFPDPAGFWVGSFGSTNYYVHLALGPEVIPLADPYNTFGTSLTNAMTDANGNWSIPLSVPNNPALQGLTLYSEAFVQDSGLLPNGLFHQSNVLTVTIQ
ncbi:MAG: VCBS repeat-containing protein, partial [Planctomycetes bacterium]|nr:VCBS repeat-containing protein [Planctomycetota bacterium]